MTLLAKFSLIFVLVGALCVAALAYYSWQFLSSNAMSQVDQQAKIMMDTALAVRGYTTANIKPILGGKTPGEKFHREIVPAFAATEVFMRLHQMGPAYADYSYKEAVLNPTNPRDQAQGWEEDLIHEFKNHPERKQIRGQREGPTGELIYLAQPLVVGTRDACLRCHDKRDEAPPEMLVEYSLGGAGGFGWKEGEIIGAQIVSVPAAQPLGVAKAGFQGLIGWLVAGGLAILAILLALLYFAVVRPIRKVVEHAESTSKGKMDAGEIQPGGTKEIAVLATAFNRMRRSLEKAMKLISGK